MLRWPRVGCHLYTNLLIVYLSYFWISIDCCDWSLGHHILLVFYQLFDAFLERKTVRCCGLVVVWYFYCWSLHLIWNKHSFLLVSLESSLVGMYVRDHCRLPVFSYCSLYPGALVVSIGWLLCYHHTFSCPSVMGHVSSGSVVWVSSF